MGETVVVWACSLDVVCPKCEHEFDVLNQDYVGDVLQGVQPLEQDAILSLTCTECEHDFKAKTTY